ncbi:probable long-chain-alcohol O-fatty-acyltransferase 2 [Ricinus communis]|uniref:Acyltransferase, putative n=1 Tax=Ricinus communis TaxID=3988 RepID=B9SSQ2_RICCO|nr:probable long-chain-alcohol O-fatty-acyltransferase 2 [Ricinus communis]EEF33332.1 acyltransferase, putative [Ricinus communis]|eukprot:XP_002529021.1 probable long-chain-alcohol O-fatty-acyltransferase 2 [Ricinus communis]
MESEIKNLIKVNLSILASLIYCYLISSKIPKGRFRLVSLLPIIILFTQLPFLLLYIFPKAITSSFISWFASFKLVLFAFDQPPLSSSNYKSLFHFISLVLLPIKFHKNKNYPSPQKPKLFTLVFPAKVLFFALLVTVLDDNKYRAHQSLLLLIFCIMAYLLIDIFSGVSNALAYAILHVEPESTSDNPYLSTSLQDFWGRRWNLMVSDLLRYTVYRPLKSRFATTALVGRATLPASLAVFLVSGLMHELLFYHITCASPTWEVTCFFLLQGLCMAVEMRVKRWLKMNGGWQLHWAVSGPLTVGFLVVTARWLFFPPLIRTGAIDAAIGECKMVISYLKRMIKL